MSIVTQLYVKRSEPVYIYIYIYIYINFPHLRISPMQCMSMGLAQKFFHPTRGHHTTFHVGTTNVVNILTRKCKQAPEAEE